MATIKSLALARPWSLALKFLTCLAAKRVHVAMFPSTLTKTKGEVAQVPENKKNEDDDGAAEWPSAAFSAENNCTFSLSFSRFSLSLFLAASLETRNCQEKAGKHGSKMEAALCLKED